MDPSKRRLDALPADVFPQLTRMLTGYDLVILSHVSRRFYQHLLPRDGVVWRERLPPNTPPPSASSSWKQVYCSSRSRRFLGSEKVDDKDARAQIRGGALEVEDMIMDPWSLEPFSIDLWFAMSSDTSTSYAGGVLLGAQCEYRLDEWWPDAYQAFIYVDPSGSLFCSMTSDQHLVASQLAFDQWHHLTLTIEHESDESVVQTIYLNGEIVHESDGCALYEEWDDLYYLQLGTGCLGSEDDGKPTEDFEGWYGFNGMIDECRFWSSALTPQQVRRLAVDHADLSTEGVVCAWSMKESPPDPFSSVASVCCTNPWERVCEMVRTQTTA